MNDDAAHLPPMTPPDPTSPRVLSAPDPVDAELAPLLSEPFARVWQQPQGGAIPAKALRQKLLQRATASRQAGAPMCTVRRRRLPPLTMAAGVSQQTLYEAPPGRALRPGEPLRARLFELAPGATLSAKACGQPDELRGRYREWLLMSGAAVLGTTALSPRDYHLLPPGFDTPACHTAQGALVFLRESVLTGPAGGQPVTVRDADAGWPDFAPRVRRRVLWQHDGQAALLYHAEPGALVPNHRHGHDEECLMVQGELFLDDLLLQAGDYQLAPAGTGHRITETDTGAVLYAHGDLDLQFVG